MYFLGAFRRAKRRWRRSWAGTGTRGISCVRHRDKDGPSADPLRRRGVQGTRCLLRAQAQMALGTLAETKVPRLPGPDPANILSPVGGTGTVHPRRRKNLPLHGSWRHCLGYQILNLVPMRSVSRGPMEFQRASCLTYTLYLRAMLHKVSPCRTRWIARTRLRGRAAFRGNGRVIFATCLLNGRLDSGIIRSWPG